mmetsp:Transcript_46178/g.91013  ORF Transcript_46178/g.91013 Transcript_46178/m.91013 type:complete len:135 (+) Transcript_46178:1229-1633(+)
MTIEDALNTKVNRTIAFLRSVLGRLEGPDYEEILGSENSGSGTDSDLAALELQLFKARMSVLHRLQKSDFILSLRNTNKLTRAVARYLLKQNVLLHTFALRLPGGSHEIPQSQLFRTAIKALCDTIPENQLSPA